MVQTSFEERLQRIEAGQDRPVSDRILAGISDEQRRMETSPDAVRTPKRTRGKIRILPFFVGFAMMYAGMMLVSNMSVIDGLLGGSDLLAPFSLAIMTSLAVAVVFLMAFFAFKVLRATMKIMAEPGRLVFAMGMVLGLALGFEPASFSDNMMAQFDRVAQVSAF